jgi:hypothetical protein
MFPFSVLHLEIDTINSSCGSYLIFFIYILSKLVNVKLKMDRLSLGCTILENTTLNGKEATLNRALDGSTSPG